ncbi:MAG: DUF4417 domain-containing protein [Clostridia bacterium]|nr:DUF4417 domain-containing protein [Clostridia bacterium]
MASSKRFPDDGMRPDLVTGTDWDGYLGFATIHNPKTIRIPSGIMPFVYRHCGLSSDEAILFHKTESRFYDFLRHPEKYVDELKHYIVISPGCAESRNLNYIQVMALIYRNRQYGHYLQSKGVYVVPFINLGFPCAFRTDLVHEKMAYLGLEKGGIYAISTCGCIDTAEDRKEFRFELEDTIRTLHPQVILVWGDMPDDIFEDLKNDTRFVHYPDWVTELYGSKG